MLYILNGRVGLDCNQGKLTCKDASVVDYILASPYFFPFIVNFCVDDFNRALSDSHCALFMDLDIIITEKSNSVSDDISNESVSGEPTHKSVWQKDKSEDFSDCLRRQDLTMLQQQLTRLNANQNLISQNHIDSLTNEIADVMLTAARNVGLVKTFHSKKPSRKKCTGNKKPWFDRDCQQRRADYRRAYKRWKQNKNPANEDNKKTFYRIYQHTINVKHNIYKKNLHKTIRNLLQLRQAKDPLVIIRLMDLKMQSLRDKERVPMIVSLSLLVTTREEQVLRLLWIMMEQPLRC